MTVTKSWTCPTCSGTLSTPYCPDCGESPPSARDLTLRGLFHQLFHALSSIDGRLIRSFQCLVTHPGALTVAYVQGRRMPHLGPVQLFLVANVLFFAMQSLTNTNIVSSTLDSHLHNQDWHAVAQHLVSHRLETMQTTLDLYAPIFDRAIMLHAKSFIILMVLPPCHPAAHSVLSEPAAVRCSRSVFALFLCVPAAVVLYFVGGCGY